AAEPQPVEDGEGEHDQRTGTGTQTHRRDRRPRRSPVEGVARQHLRVGRVRMAAGGAGVAGAVRVPVVVVFVMMPVMVFVGMAVMVMVMMRVCAAAVEQLPALAPQEPCAEGGDEGEAGILQ